MNVATQAEKQVETPETLEKKEGQGQEKTTFTQSELDAAIAKAIQTRERKIREEFETKALVEQQKYKELYEKAEAEKAKLALQAETNKTLAQKGLSELATVFESDFSALENRVKTAELLDAVIKAQVEKRVRELSKTPITAQGTTNSPAKTPDQMTPAEWAEYKKQHKLY